MKRSILYASLGAVFVTLQTLPVTAQDHAVPAIIDPIGEIRAAALVGEQDSMNAAMQEILAAGDPAQIFEMARLLTRMPTEHILPTADPDRAMALYRLVAGSLEGLPGRDARRLLQRAQYELATLMVGTATHAEQLDEARTLIERSATGGYGRAALRLGEGLANGEFGTVDLERSVLWLRRALNLGVGEAAFALSAQLRRQGGDTVDEEESLARLGIAMLRNEALRGDIGQAVTLARAYLDHPVIPQDVNQADEWLQFAIARGEPTAMVQRARLLLEGAFGEPDPIAARDLLVAAAGEGSVDAALMLAGTLQQQGDLSLPIEPDVANAWLERALLVREPRAFRLGARLAAERGDLATHRQLLEQAVGLGDVHAGIDLIAAQVAAGELDRAAATMRGMELRVGVSNSGAVGLADLKLAGDAGSPLHDPIGGMALLNAAADRGDGAALYRLGLLHSEGILVAQDLEAAADYFRRSADRDYFLSILRLVRTHEQGIGVERSPELADDWLERARRAADLGPSDRMVSLGRALLDGLIASSGAEEGLRWLQRAADRGNARAMVTLAGSYLDGSAGTFDPERSFSLYQSAVAAGDIDANYYVGRAHATGIGVPVDLRAAVEHFSLAARAGNASAATELGLIYSSGGAMPLDYQLSYEWLHRAAEMGHVPAMIYLSNLIATGAFDDIADQSAMYWLVRAAGSGDGDAQFQLAIALKRGLLGEVDLNGAEYWLRQATMNGHFQAQSELQRLLHELEKES